jgi:hypothetical protein
VLRAYQPAPHNLDANSAPLLRRNRQSLATDKSAIERALDGRRSFDALDDDQIIILLLFAGGREIRGARPQETVLVLIAREMHQRRARPLEPDLYAMCRSEVLKDRRRADGTGLGAWGPHLEGLALPISVDSGSVGSAKVVIRGISANRSALCSQTMFISLPPVAARTQQTHDFARGIGRLNK